MKNFLMKTNMMGVLILWMTMVVVQGWTCPSQMVVVTPTTRTRIHQQSWNNHLKKKNQWITTSDSTCCQMTTTNNNNDDDVKIEKRKKRVIVGYQVTALLYLVTLLTTITTRKIRLDLLVFSTMAYILKGAASHDRLTSDTYKRMNLQLGLYGMFVLSTHSSSSSFLLILSSFLACINSIKGYGYGILGWNKQKKILDTLPQELQTGLSFHFKNTLIPSSKFKSLGYQLMTCFLGAISICHFQKKQYFVAVTNALYSAITLTLKDASDRNRLDGTTFIQLNYLSSILFASLTTKYYSSSMFTTTNKQTWLFFTALSSSLFTLFNGLNSFYQKKKSTN